MTWLPQRAIQNVAHVSVILCKPFRNKAKPPAPKTNEHFRKTSHSEFIANAPAETNAQTMAKWSKLNSSDLFAHIHWQQCSPVGKEFTWFRPIPLSLEMLIAPFRPPFSLFLFCFNVYSSFMQKKAIFIVKKRFNNTHNPIVALATFASYVVRWSNHFDIWPKWKCISNNGFL